MDINIAKGRLQGEGRSRLEFSPVLVLCLNLAEYTPSIVGEKASEPRNSWAFLSMFRSAPLWT
jgi:hypothetical protein